MTLLIQSEELVGRLDLRSAIDVVREAFTRNGHDPGFGPTHTRFRHGDSRATVHPGGSLAHRTAGMFMHFESLRTQAAEQDYNAVGRRVYVAYDSEISELLAMILGSLPLFPFDSPRAFATETPITSAVGTQLLARPESSSMALIGTGRQARRHLYALAPLFPLSAVRVFSRDEEKRRSFCAEMREHIAAPLEPVGSVDEAVQDADLVVCATASSVPVLNGARLQPGAHVTSIVNGQRTDPRAPYRRELDDETLRRADVLCAVLPEQGVKDQQGDLAEPVEKGIIAWDDVLDMSRVLAGKQEGRTGPAQITVFKQNSDQGVGFMALARLAYERACADGIGVEV